MHYVVGVFWLLPPPYLRWLAAALVFLAVGGIEAAGRSTEQYPFAAAAIPRGGPLVGAVEWRDVPRGLLPPPGDPDAFAARALEPGEPITANSVDPDDGVPAGWWSVPIELPDAATAGTDVRLISVETALDVIGIVVAEAGNGAFAAASPGLVAVPPENASAIASAVSAGRLIILIGE